MKSSWDINGVDICILMLDSHNACNGHGELAVGSHDKFPLDRRGLPKSSRIKCTVQYS
jgi:hypothetical protein